MLSDGQLITAVTGVFGLNREAKKLGLKLVRLEGEPGDVDMNECFEVHRKGVDTGFYVQIGMGEVSLDHFDGDGSTEIARMGKSAFATNTTDFVATIIEKVTAND
jgi:hypothetical protein